MSAILAGLLFLAGTASAQDREARIARLVDQLGSDDFDKRETAENELKKIGAPAVPLLKKALEDADAERADRARRILVEIEKLEKKTETEKKPGRNVARIHVVDITRGVTFDQDGNGRVTLRVPEANPDTGKKEYKTYAADSLEEFKEKHPEVAKKWEIDRFVHRGGFGGLDRALPDAFKDFRDSFRDFRSPFGDKDLEELFKSPFEKFGDPLERFRELQREFEGFRNPLEEFEARRRRLEEEWRKPLEEIEKLRKQIEELTKKLEVPDLAKLLEEQQKRIEEFRKKFEPQGPRKGRGPAPQAAREFGIKIEPVNETLAEQLDLKEGEGVQLGDVKAGSRAEKAGLRKHDVILSLNGKPVVDKWAFREQIVELMDKGFELGIVRAGKHETVKVRAEE